MIKFFKKTRLQLMTKNKLSKYLLYALGEIILVVIGILIALQINNSNNYNNNRKLEQEYLVSLKSEFETNLTKIENCISETEQQVKAVEGIFSLFDNSILDSTNQNTLANKIFPVFSGETNYIPTKGVLTDLISSGNLNLIQNKTLRQKLSSFESHLILVKAQENGSYSIKSDLKNIHHINGSVRTLMVKKGFKFENNSISDKTNIKQLFKSIEFENRLLDYYMTAKSTNGQKFYLGLKQEIEFILLEIEKELK